MFYRTLEPLRSSGVSDYIYASFFRVIDNDLYEFIASSYNEKKIEGQGRDCRCDEYDDSSEALEALQTMIIEAYLQIIHLYEGLIDIAEECQKMHKKDTDYSGSYAFYTYDALSLKALAEYEMPQSLVSEEEPYKQKGEIIFENNRPSFIEITTYRKNQESMNTSIDFDYDKQPTIPEDATPGEWVPELDFIE